jgi:hypothetical protein
MANHGYGLDYLGDLDYQDDHVPSPVKSTKVGVGGKKMGDKKETKVKKEDAFESPVGKLYHSIHSPATKKKLDDFNRKKRVDAYRAEKKEKAAKKSRIEALVAKKNPGPKLCEYCTQAPCCMDDYYDEMMEIGTEMEGKHDHKEIRHAMYRHMARKLWGSLGKGVRRELPKCIIAEVHDAYPTKKGKAYVGFQPCGSYKSIFLMEDSEESD